MHLISRARLDHASLAAVAGPWTGLHAGLVVIWLRIPGCGAKGWPTLFTGLALGLEPLAADLAASLCQGSLLRRVVLPQLVCACDMRHPPRARVVVGFDRRRLGHCVLFDQHLVGVTACLLVSDMFRLSHI